MRLVSCCKCDFSEIFDLIQVVDDLTSSVLNQSDFGIYMSETRIDRVWVIRLESSRLSTCTKSIFYGDPHPTTSSKRKWFDSVVPPKDQIIKEKFNPISYTFIFHFIPPFLLQLTFTSESFLIQHGRLRRVTPLDKSNSIQFQFSPMVFILGTGLIHEPLRTNQFANFIHVALQGAVSKAAFIDTLSNF